MTEPVDKSVYKSVENSRNLLKIVEFRSINRVSAGMNAFMVC